MMLPGKRSRYSDWLRPGRSGIESRWGPVFPHLSRLALGPTQPPYNGSRIFPGDKKRPGRNANPSPPSSAVVKKEYSYTSTPPMGRRACTEPQCLYKGVFFTLLQTYEFLKKEFFYLGP